MICANWQISWVWPLASDAKMQRGRRDAVKGRKDARENAETQGKRSDARETK